MKKIVAKHVEATMLPEQPQDVPALLDAENVEFVAIGTNNWPDAFPHTPKVEVRVAHADTTLLLHYRVEEDSVQAVAADNGNVWEDSCCEFFSIPAGDGVYYNIESTVPDRCSSVREQSARTASVRHSRCSTP